MQIELFNLKSVPIHKNLTICTMLNIELILTTHDSCINIFFLKNYSINMTIAAGYLRSSTVLCDV